MLEKSNTERVAILVANGFLEDEVTSLQKSLIKKEGCFSFISPEQGLVNSWQNNMWGLNYPVDVNLNSALASDFSSLIIPGGIRSCNKLLETAHTKRFVNSFMFAEKPIVAINEAINILIDCELVKDKIIACEPGSFESILSAGAKFSEEPFYIDSNLLTINNLADQYFYGEEIANFVMSNNNLKIAA